MNITDEQLMAYADGELEASERAAIEAALKLDPQLAARVERHRALRGRLQAAYDPVLKEPIPQRLMAALGSGQGAQHTAQVLPFRPRVVPHGHVPRKARPWLQWGTVAASLIVGVLLGTLVKLGGNPDAGWVASNGGAAVARGALAQALNTQLASTQGNDAAIRLNVSFKDRSGAYCRAFSSGGSGALAGVACRSGNDWQLQMLSSAPAGSSGANYRQAGSSLPSAVLDRVQAQISGEPLDAAGEAQAAKAGWR
ncbi:MAG: hypothetical protein QM718_15145 [Steroidobacteraceae bacterium]